MKNKKAISVIIGYVLLIVLALSMSLIVYSWLKKHTLAQEQECPDTISILLSDYSCDSSSKTINLTLKNTGLFNINGVIIKVANDSNRLPVYYMEYQSENTGELVVNQDYGKLLFPNNFTASSGELILNFDYSNQTTIKKIDIIPLYLNKRDMLICSNKKISQEISKC